MSLDVSASEGKTFETAPAGLHEAVCTAIAAVGPTKNSFGTISNKVYLKFEIPSENGDPTELWQMYGQSINSKSNLGAALCSWRGRQFTYEERRKFNLVNILGVSATLNIEHNEHNGRTYANIADRGRQIMPAKNKLEPSEKPWAFDFDDKAQTNFDKLPKFIQNMVEKNREALQAPVQSSQKDDASGVSDIMKAGEPVNMDSIPF